MAKKKKKSDTRKLQYSKKILGFVIINCVAMMWCSYLLAWFEKVEIAETLSKTVATSILGVTIPYLITSTVEKINQYGSRLNNTIKDDSEGGNI